MFARAGNGEPFASKRARLGALQHGGGAAQVAAGERRGRGHDLLRRALRNDVAAEAASAGAEIEHIVGVADRVFIVLDDKNGVAEVAKLFQSFNQAIVVALMEADGRLVENVEDAAEARADLRGEANALAFAAGERGGVAVEREVIEADGAQEFKALGNFAANALGDQRFALSELKIDGGRKRAVERQGSEVGDGEAANFDCERFGAQALAAANGAGSGRHETHHVLAIALAARFFHVVAQVGEDAVKAGARRFAFGRAVDEDVLLLRRQIFERRLEIDLVAVGGELDELESGIARRSRGRGRHRAEAWTSR